jgi:predicted Zn finger-like uncharacterized protein
MALATRCPHCETVFRLDPHLLAPHDGRVRCGHCQEVFDAAHHRFELPEDDAAPGDTQHAAIVDDDVAIGPSSSPAHAPEPAPTPVRPTVAAPRTLDVGASLAGRPAVPIPPPPVSLRSDEDSGRTGYAGRPTPAESKTPPDDRVRQFVRVGAPSPTEPPAPVPTPFVASVDDRAEPFIGTAGDIREERPAPAPAPAPDWRNDDEPGFGAKPPGVTHPASANEAFPVMREPRPMPPLRRPRRGFRIVGIVFAVLLALLLIVQVAWWEREEVMVMIPGTHSLYANVCDELGCNISPPRDIDGLQIESSGLRQVDGPHKLELKLSLRNRLDVALAYPALELTLLDDKNNVALRRVLWPQDYARPGTIFAIGLPAQSAQPVVVRLDTGDAVAANYRVQVFYP